MTKLSVNLNKFALLRNARGSDMPNLIRIAEACLAAGAHGITVHPRPDQRHTRYQDVNDLADLVKKYADIEFNVEGYPSDAFLELVLQARPHQCTLVPDAPDQLTSDHGWDIISQQQQLTAIIARLKDAGIRSSLFVDPEPDQVKAAPATGTDRLELYTEAYAKNFNTTDHDAILKKYQSAAQTAGDLSVELNAGHDLNLENLGCFLKSVPGILEVSIGHALVCESVEHGLDSTIKKYLAVIREAFI